MKVFVTAEKNEHNLFRGVIKNEAGVVIDVSKLEYTEAVAAKRVMIAKLSIGVHKYVHSLQKLNK